jgi:hypothetical protein
LSTSANITAFPAVKDTCYTHRLGVADASLGKYEIIIGTTGALMGPLAGRLFDIAPAVLFLSTILQLRLRPPRGPTTFEWR